MCSTTVRILLGLIVKVNENVSSAPLARGVDDVVLVRVEQLFPFPHEALARRLARYPDAELVWCQEEPKNMGFWTFVQPRVNTAVRELLQDGAAGGGGGGGGTNNTIITREVRYVGRPAAASPATGSPTIHAAETKALINEALGLRRKSAWD